MSKRFLLLLLAHAAWGCVDTSERASEPAVTRADEPEPIVLDLSDPVPAELRTPEPAGLYRWQNVTIKGGGFVTGIVFSTKVPNLIYARTDVGGAYRWNMSDERWVPITDFVGQNNTNLIGIESIATDPVEPGRVVVAAGTYLPNHGTILVSTDYGASWTQRPVPIEMGGNADGRSMGERLAIDPNLNSRLYFGTRNNGLWTSADFGMTWQHVPSFTAQGTQNMGLSFVVFDPRSGTAGAGSRTIYVGVTSLTGETLYRSSDAGATWQPVPCESLASLGMMPHHGVLAPDGMLYLAYNDRPGPNEIERGAVWKLDTATDRCTDISPGTTGFGGVTVDAQRPETITVSTIDVWPDEIHRSLDGGRSWFKIGPKARRDPNGAQWLYFGGGNLSATGWMGDIEIDPFNRSRALYVTGQGIWWSDNITDTDPDLPTDWTFRNDGLEETVALDLVSPPEGAHLLSAVGDIAGFRHDDFAVSPPGGMYENPVFGNTNSIDFAQNAPATVVRVGTGGSGRRGAHSTDGGSSWLPFATEPTSTRDDGVQLAWAGSGSVAVSADGATFVWAGASCRNQSNCGNAPHYTTDAGATWHASAAAAADGSAATWGGTVRLAADRVNPSKFYAVSQGTVYVSTNGGQSFTATSMTNVQGGRLRPVFGVEGDVWLVSGAGLFRSTDSAATFSPVSSVSAVRGVGFGQAAPGATYPSVYLSGVVGGTPGIYRSDDGGVEWVRLNDNQHQFGYVDHITGDPRVYGRVYLGSGGRGILFGEPR